ncbi:hypothetical protein CQA66_08905 [Helicobacter aurati]|uniref:Uncharacterized protein n=1 Tax=Helicobacter aurati TaxID=137778 RepID=A0A3D8IWS6_9HELI|nr:hypothetical protein [Helicobacter aurati]RDU69718.1 hypothetical protein CQA66_08905 [Helicobacter aurati]
MKKIISSIVSSVILSSVLSLSFMQAKAINQNLESMTATNKAATISQADANFLFNNIETSKVALLDSEEMKETKGAFWGAIIIGLGSWGFNCLLFGKCRDWQINIRQPLPR